MPSLDRLTGGIPPATILVTYALGGLGGLLAQAAGLPLALLLGAMVAVTAASALGLRVSGQPLAVPQKWRYALIPVVGVAIGAGFPPDFATQARQWWVTMAALLVFIPVGQFLGYAVFARLGRLQPATAYFAAMPGGFIESIEMGEKNGAEMPMLILLQLLRLILCIVLIPVGFSIVEGHAVGSVSGLSQGPAAGMDLRDWLWIAGLGIVGWWGADRLKLPAAMLSGPLLLSGIAHAASLTDAVPPGWAIQIAQWVMGTSLGVRLIGFRREQAARALILSVVHVSLMLLIALGIALTLAGAVGEPVAAVILAFAPGGVSEMSLVALSLQVSAVFVTLHHLARIVLAVVMSRLGQRFVRL